MLLQQLALLKGMGLDGLDPTGAEFIHLQVGGGQARLCRSREILRRSRTSPRCRSKRLLSDTYNADRRKLITDKASLELRPGSVCRIRGRLSSCAAKAARASPSAALGRRRDRPSAGMGEVRGDTVHFDIIDRAGNMISATPSGGWLQSSPVIPELGFGLGTRAQAFWLDENHPAGLRPASVRARRLARRSRCATANPISPGARPAATSRTNGRRSSSFGTFIAR